MTTMRSVSRITNLLQCVAAEEPHGVGVSELAKRAGLDKATALRLARSLVHTGWVQRNAVSGNFHVGPEAWLAGRRGNPGLTRLARRAEDVLGRLAASTGDTAYLALRSGTEVVFLHREDGENPIRGRREVGHRQILAIGCTGAACLSAMTEEEVSEQLSRMKSDMRRLGIPEEPLRAQIEDARRAGLAIVRGGVFYEVPAIGMPLLDELGNPVAA